LAYAAISEGSVRKHYRRVTTQAGSQKQIKHFFFYEIKHMSLNFKHGLMISKLQHNKGKGKGVP